MNRFKFEAYKQEFPALNTLLLDRSEQPRNPIDCDEIKIARVTRELLGSKPHWSSHSGSIVSISKKETVAFLLKDGTLIKDAVKQSGSHGSNYAYTDSYTDEGETYLESIFRHSCSGVLALIFVVKTGFAIRNHCSETNFSVTIYKPSKTESITETIAEAISSASAEVRAEANF